MYSFGRSHRDAVSAWGWLHRNKVWCFCKGKKQSKVDVWRQQCFKAMCVCPLKWVPHKHSWQPCVLGDWKSESNVECSSSYDYFSWNGGWERLWLRGNCYYNQEINLEDICYLIYLTDGWVAYIISSHLTRGMAYNYWQNTHQSYWHSRLLWCVFRLFSPLDAQMTHSTPCTAFLLHPFLPKWTLCLIYAFMHFMNPSLIIKTLANHNPQ